ILMKSPKAATALTMAMTMRISRRVNPSRQALRTGPARGLAAMGVEVLGDFIDWGDDRDRDEPDDEPHDDHQHRLNRATEPLGHLVYVVLVEVGEVLEGGDQVPGGLPYRHHVREHGREDVGA